jgi:hypothetical protein
MKCALTAREGEDRRRIKSFATRLAEVGNVRLALVEPVVNF